MSRLRLVFVLVASTWLLPGDAVATNHVNKQEQDQQNKRPPAVTSISNAKVRVEGSAPGRGGGPSVPAPRRPQPAAPLYSYRTIQPDGAGSYCTLTRYTRDKARAAFINAAGRDTGNILAVSSYPPCPRAPRPLREVARELAREFWDERELPSPTLRAAPGWAITGKSVYLEILGDRERTIEVDNPIGPDVVIHATSEYVIDWGDPYDRKVTRTRSPGGPWPHGDVTHVYTDVGTVTIAVTQRWRATWKAGGEEGTLAALRTEGSLPDFRVVQLQAVRRR